MCKRWWVCPSFHTVPWSWQTCPLQLLAALYLKSWHSTPPLSEVVCCVYNSNILKWSINIRAAYMCMLPTYYSNSCCIYVHAAYDTLKHLISLKIPQLSLKWFILKTYWVVRFELITPNPNPGMTSSSIQPPALAPAVWMEPLAFACKLQRIRGGETLAILSRR